MLENYYAILDLAENASVDEIKQAYRKLALQFHPDINPDPEAHSKFIEISHAYEYLLEKASHEHVEEKTYVYNFDEEYGDILKEIRNEARARAQKQREMKKETERKRKEEFQKSGLYDISLILQYSMHFLAILAGLALILFPIYIGITQDFTALLYLFYFWLVGIFLLSYIFSKRKTWFKLGKFYFRWKDILPLLNYRNLSAAETCQYSRNRKADGYPFRHTLLIVRDIQLKNRGPLQHDARYKRDYIELRVPRSRQAFLVHLTTSLIKILAISFAFILLPMQSLVWKFILGALAGGILSTLLLLFTKTKSCHTYILNPTILMKLGVWIFIILALTKFYSPFQIITSEYTLVTFTLTSFFIDLIIDPIAGLLFKKNLWKPILNQPAQIAQYFDLGYQNNLEIPVWSTLSPIISWLF